LSGQVLTYFRKRPRGAGEDVTQTRLLQQVEAGFEHSPLAGVAKRCVDEAVAAEIESMPMWPQHGDFVVNNLGHVGKRLVAFDWEDYGKVSLPGLDILTLALSLTGMTVQGTAAIVGRAGGAAFVDAFLRTTCEAQALDLPRFRRMVPFYLLVFLHLKRSYGVAVQQRIASLLKSLAAPAGLSHEEF
jgi:hypothetical protein